MRSSYLDYAMSVIVGRALPDVRDGLKPVHRRVLFAMHEAGLQPNRAVPQVRARRRRRDGPLPPARRRRRSTTRWCGWRRTSRMRYPLIDGQGNFGSIDNDPAAAMRYTEARLARLATRDAARHRRRHRRLRAELRRVAARAARPAGALPEPARQRLVGHRGRHGDEHPAAQPARDDRRRDRLHRRPGDRHRRPDEAHQGPGLPDRRHHRRPPGHPRRLRDGPRPRARAGARPHRAAAPGQGGDHRHRAALPGTKGDGRNDGSGSIKKIAEVVNDKKIPEISDLRDESDKSRHAPRHRAQARRDPQGRAQQALQAHADADDVRREHGRARRRRAAHAAACARSSTPTSTTSARSSSAAPSTSCARPRSARTSSRACSSRSTTSTR